MKAEIKPTESLDVLMENLEKRVVSADSDEDTITVEIEDVETLERIPGIEEFTSDGETYEGLGGRPVQENAYARLETRNDVVRAFLATVMGYNLIVLNGKRDWDLKLLRRFNPDIKELKADEPKEFLEVKKSLFEHEDLEQVEIDLEDEDIDTVYRFINP